jgi:hypothetical protein
VSLQTQLKLGREYFAITDTNLRAKCIEVDELEKELKVESSWSTKLENELKDKWEANA